MINGVYIGLEWDDGHDMNTAGKRTPLFPDGSFMRENEFNRDVKRRVVALCKDIPGIDEVNLTAPGDGFTSLSDRVAAANKRYLAACEKYGKDNVIWLFVSIHANAYKGVWGDHGGTSVFYSTGSVEGRKLADAIHGELMKGTPLRDRKVQDADFYVLKYTKMPAALIEAAFMDNMYEAKLLLSEAFRKEVALETFDGVKEYIRKRLGLMTIDMPREMFRVIIDGKQVMALSTVADAMGEVNAWINARQGLVGRIVRKSDGVQVYQYSIPEPAVLMTWQRHISGEAVRDLQAAANNFFGKKVLTVDGFYGDNTKNKLPNDIRYHMYNRLVGEIQKRLKALGYYNGVVDNSFGPKTLAGVQALQVDRALKMTGVVDRATFSQLYHK